RKKRRHASNDRFCDARWGGVRTLRLGPGQHRGPGVDPLGRGYRGPGWGRWTSRLEWNPPWARRGGGRGVRWIRRRRDAPRKRLGCALAPARAMSLLRLFVANLPDGPGRLDLPEGASHHARVMRLGVGDELVLFDGK